MCIDELPCPSTLRPGETNAPRSFASIFLARRAVFPLPSVFNRPSIAHVPRLSSFAVKRRSSIFHLPSSIVALFSLFPLSFLLVLLLALAPVAFAATYYVDATGGRDTNAGLSEAVAWKTIAKVNASRFVPGDQILFKRGEVWRETLVVPSSGTSTNLITFGGYGAGSLPVINGSEIITDWSLESGYIYKASTTWTAKQLFQNGQRLARKESKGDLVLGSWYQDPSTKVLYITTQDGTSPALFLVEASQRAYGVYIYGHGCPVKVS